MSASLDFYRHGVALCTEAVDAEEHQRFDEAFNLYMRALDAFEMALRTEKQPANVTMIRAAMVSPLERAERLKGLRDWSKMEPDDNVEVGMLERLGRLVSRFGRGGGSDVAPRSALTGSWGLPPPPGTTTTAATSAVATKPVKAAAVVQPAVQAAPPPVPVRRSAGAPASAAPQSSAGAASSFAVVAAKTQYPELAGIDKAMQRKILDLAAEGQGVRWDDIAGLRAAKATLYEMVILPSLRPEFFTGLRKPPSGLLLFGPPGCGKTLLAKAVATEAKAAFFSISASALMSKYLGESEGLVKALFAVARAVAPSVVFIDEIDSLLSERSDNEHEASRRVKTEFLIQWDGIQPTSGSAEKRILVMGATNRPYDLDEAATRRMPKRVYIPLPDVEARHGAISHLLASTPHALDKRDLDRVALMTEGYSQSDLASVCSQAAMGPVREMGDIRHAPLSALRPIALVDFERAVQLVRPSVDPASLARYEEYNRNFGSTGL